MAPHSVRQDRSLINMTMVRKRFRMRISKMIVSSILFAFACPVLGQTDQDVTAAKNVSDAQLKSACDNDRDRIKCGLYAQRVGNGTAETERDMETAAKYFSKGCDLSAGVGCLMYGRMRRSGIGGAATEDDVLEIFKTACRARIASSDGCIEAGIILMKRVENGSPDRSRDLIVLASVEPQILFVRSCELNSPIGCYYAGKISTGMGKAREAVTYFEKACSNNVEDSCALRAELTAKLEKYDAERSKANATAAPDLRAPTAPAKLSVRPEQRNACSVAYGAANALWEQAELPPEGAEDNLTFASRQYVVLGLNYRRDAYPDDLFMQSLQRVQDLRTNPIGEDAVLREITQCDALFGYKSIEIQ